MLNKFPFHRILVLFTLFSVSLTACTPAPALTPTATLPVETPKPSATATEPPTATATKDPNKPPDATGKDASGNYIKETAEGTFTWTVLKDETGKEIVKLWTQSHINPGTSDLRGGIPLTERSDDMGYNRDMDPLYILSQEGFNMPYFSHPDFPDTGDSGINSFTTYYNTLIRKASGLSTMDAFTTRNQANGTLSIDFTNGKSKFTWETAQGVLFIGMRQDQLIAEKFPDLILCKTIDLRDSSLKSLWTSFTDENHRLVILSTTPNFEGLAHDQMLRMVVGPLGSVTLGNVPEKARFMNTQQMVKFGLEGSNPHFVISLEKK